MFWSSYSLCYFCAKRWLAVYKFCGKADARAFFINSAAINSSKYGNAWCAMCLFVCNQTQHLRLSHPNNCWAWLWAQGASVETAWLQRKGLVFVSPCIVEHSQVKDCFSYWSLVVCKQCKKLSLPWCVWEGVYKNWPISLVLCPVSGRFWMNVEMVSISDGMIQCLYH